MHIDQGYHLQGASLGTPGVVKDDYKTVFVRNISFKASEAEITDFFTQAGKVEDVRRGTDDTGLCCAVFLCSLQAFCGMQRILRFVLRIWSSCLQL